VLPQVFDRFASFRDERRRGRGTGLGLPIARAIAEAHEGTIAVTSAPGEGTTVTFRLPGLVVAGQLGAAQPFRLRRAA
jgi:signal transduction histidine kinase